MAATGRTYPQPRWLAVRLMDKYPLSMAIDTQPEPHLDANQLSALLDGNLLESARSAAMEHLSGCSRCRQCALLVRQGLDFAAGATPFPVPGSRPAGAVHIPPTWRTWATAAAAIVVAGAIWAAQPRLIFAPAPAAPTSARTAVHTATHAARRPAAAAPTSTALAATSRPATLPQARISQPASAASAADYMLPSPPRAASDQPAAWDAAAVREPASNLATNHEFEPPMDFTPLTTGFQDQPRIHLLSAAPYGAGSTSALQNSALAMQASNTLSGAGSSMPASTWDIGPDMGFASGFADLSSGRSPLPMSGPYAPAAPTGFGWAISRGGEVLRSVGAGAWVAVPLLPSVRVHALFASGGAVWAGGKATQLFVSHDRGAHWRRVQLPQAGTGTAVVANILFTAPETGQVTLSDGRTWTTADGGQSWTLRP